MRAMDFHWMARDEWWHFVNYTPVVRPDAPIEAKVSYERYLEQLEAEASD